MAAWQIAMMNVRLAMRSRAAFFFTFILPLIFLFFFGALFAGGSPEVVAFLFGPVVVIQIVASTFWGLGMQSVAMRERGSLRRYRLAPVGPGGMVVASLIANYLLLLPTVALLLIVARLAFHMPMRFPWWEFLLVVTVGDFAFAGFGLTLGNLADTMQEAAVYNNAAFFPLIFLSGATIPLAEMPSWLQRVAAFIPATYLVSAFQGLMPRPTPLADHAVELVVLVISGVFGLLLAIRLFRWEKEERIPTRRRVWAAVFAVPFLLTGAWMNRGTAVFARWKQTYQAVAAGSGQAAAQAPGPVGLVSDFDDGSQPAARFGTGWQVTTDAMMGGHSTARIEVVAGGAQGSRGALQITGTIASGASYPWAGAIFYPGPAPFQPANLAGAKALSFWAQGDGKTYAVLFFTASHGYVPAVQTFVAGAEWKQFSFPLSAFGTDGHDAEAVAFSGTAPGPFTLRIDTVRFPAKAGQ